MTLLRSDGRIEADNRTLGSGCGPGSVVCGAEIGAGWRTGAGKYTAERAGQ